MAQVHQVDRMNISLHPNPLHWEGTEYKPKSTSAIVLAFLDTTNGAFRSLQILDKTFSLLGRVTQVPAFQETAKICGHWTVLGITRVPGALKDTKDALVALFRASSAIPGAFFRRCLTALQESAGLISSLGYVATPFLQITEKTAGVGKSVLRAAEVSTFVADTCDLVKNSGDAVRTGALAKRVQKMDVSSDLKEALSATHRLHMIKTMKAICSVSCFVLGLGLAATGLAVLPGVAMTIPVISLAGTLFATKASLHEDGMKYKRVQLLNDRHVQFIPVVSVAI